MIFSNDKHFDNYLVKARGITKTAIVKEIYARDWYNLPPMNYFYPFSLYRIFDALGRGSLKIIYPLIGFIVPLATIISMVILISRLDSSFSLEVLLSPTAKLLFLIFIAMLVLPFLTIIVAYRHALHIYQKYQLLAGQVLDSLEGAGNNINNSLKKAIIYGKVYNDRNKLFALVTECLQEPGGDSQLWDLAGKTILSPISAPNIDQMLPGGYGTSDLWGWHNQPSEDDAGDLAEACFKRAH